MLPPLMYVFAIFYITLALVSAVVVAADLTLHPQKMRVMNWVWPLTMLYLGPVGLGFYYFYGRDRPLFSRWLLRKKTPLWAQALKSAMHCGAGCALGDFFGEGLVYFSGFTLFGSELLGKYVVAFVLAYLFGLLFQYLALAPMRKRQGFLKIIKAAIISDTFSLIAYEIGMFVWMGFTRYLYPDLQPTLWDYWFMMQVAMTIGLATTYPVNRWLIARGIKEAM